MRAEQTSKTDAISVLREAGSLLFVGTESYLCCDATQSETIAIQMKELEPNKEIRPMLFVSSFTMLEGYIPQIPEAAYQLIEVSENPIIVEFSESRNLASEVMSPEGSVLAVVFSDGIIHSVVNRFRKPLFAINTKQLVEFDVNSIQTIESGHLQINDSSWMKFHADQSFKIVRA
tara:strand:+ start:891 stop:1415 length:525 start_codon:yes stop_codon:yes gene_type:complete